MQLHKRDVVDAATTLLDDYGIADLTMRRLARELQVSPGALYWHFANKQQLLGAVADRILESVDDVPAGWRDPFSPAQQAAWMNFTPIEELFVYNGSGVMPGRTWVIAPDRESLEIRWKTLTRENDPARKELLFHAHLRRGKRPYVRQFGDSLVGWAVCM